MAGIHSILFVCSGNMFRSAGAEVILRQKLHDAGITDVEVASAGTLDLGHRPRPAGFADVLLEHGYLLDRVTEYFHDVDVVNYDLILVMEPQHEAFLKEMLPQDQWGKIRLFIDYCFASRDILPDPSLFYYREQYYGTLDKLEEGCDVILKRLREERP